MRAPIVAPLPNPSDVATRQREQTATIAHANGSRILWVHALEDGMVVLEEADGTVIDEAVPWIGAFDPIVGDKVIRLSIPGRGSKHAAPAYVAIGPVKAGVLTGRSVQDLTVTGHFKHKGAAPSVSVGAALGTGGSVGVTIAGTDQVGVVTITAGTTSLTTGVAATITFATPRSDTQYVVKLDGRAVAGGVNAVQRYPSGLTTTVWEIRYAVAPASGAVHAWGYQIWEWGN